MPILYADLFHIVANHFVSLVNEYLRGDEKSVTAALIVLYQKIKIIFKPFQFLLIILSEMREIRNRRRLIGNLHRSIVFGIQLAVFNVPFVEMLDCVHKDADFRV